jgi:glycerophosphoryl diester phosphodiesterase
MHASARRRRRFLDADRPIAFAHRGGAALWPENTLAAFRGALGLGLRWLETDGHMTRDGVIVLCHDAGLERTTDGAGLVRDHTLAELRELDAGWRFSTDGGRSFPWRGKGLTIPTLEDVLALGDDVRVNLEIKQRAPSMARPLWDLVRRLGAEDRILVAAEQDPLVRELRAVSGGRVATSAGRREVTAFWLAVRTGLDRLLPIHYDALQVPVRSGRLRIVDERFIAAAHRRGIQVHVWTIDEPSEMRALVALGVDGIMTDRPDLLLAHGLRS